jgi:hypothetical protein
MAFWDEIEVTSFDDSGAVVAISPSARPIEGLCHCCFSSVFFIELMIKRN